MKTIRVEEAVGRVLAHDMTQIIKDEFKGSRFKKGHIIIEEDIPVLLDMGKENIYVFEMTDGVHEDEAAIRLATACMGEGLKMSKPSEGKVQLSAAYKGLLKIDTDRLFEINNCDEVMFASLHTNQIVEEGQIVAGTRVIPLVVDESVVAEVENIAKNNPIARVIPLKKAKVGIVTTGSEVFSGRIKDSFGPVIMEKFAKLGSEVIGQEFASDDEETIVSAILKFIESGADIVAVTGGMSVDPDDRTPASIKKAGADIVTYGVPVLPGAMFLLGYIGEVAVVGLPGCVMYHNASIFEIVLPRLLAGEKMTKKDFRGMGHGGLCRNCAECTFPNCSFGKF